MCRLPQGDLQLQVGEVRFAGAGSRLRTILGSCVAITVWHPQRKIGGMCHYLLPSRNRAPAEGLDGRYADEALKLLLGFVHDAGGQIHDYEVKMFGGGNMFPSPATCPGQHVGWRNVHAGAQLLRQSGIECVALHVGGVGHRQIILDLASGEVWMKHLTPKTRLACVGCQKCAVQELCQPAFM